MYWLLSLGFFVQIFNMIKRKKEENEHTIKALISVVQHYITQYVDVMLAKAFSSYCESGQMVLAGVILMVLAGVLKAEQKREKSRK